MFLSKEFIQELIHDADYNPAQRREYYLRTRELKGRDKVGVTGQPSIGRPDRATLPVRTKPAESPKPKSKSEQIEAQVADLKARLEQLRAALRQLVKEAQIRSGIDPTEAAKPGSTQKPTNKPEKTPEKLTPEQQAAKEKADAEYYEKNKDKILSDQVKDLDNKIKAIQAKIKLMREQAAIPQKKFQTQVGSVGAATTSRVRKENSQNGRR